MDNAIRERGGLRKSALNRLLRNNRTERNIPRCTGASARLWGEYAFCRRYVGFVRRLWTPLSVRDLYLGSDEETGRSRAREAIRQSFGEDIKPRRRAHDNAAPACIVYQAVDKGTGRLWLLAKGRGKVMSAGGKTASS